VRSLLLIPLLAMAAMAPAFAQTEEGEVKQMREACAKSDVPQAQIEACTKLIDTRLLQGRELAQALYQRGAGHAAKGEYQEAVRDYTQALKFAPNSSDARTSSRTTCAPAGCGPDPWC